MTTIKFPYGKTHLEANISEKHLKGVLLSHLNEYVPTKSENELVEEALTNPIESKGLSELSVGKKNIVIICSDHTRPVPSKIIIPLM